MKSIIHKLSKLEKLQMLANRAMARGHKITPTRLMLESMFLYCGTVLDTDKEVINFCKALAEN